VIVTVIIMEMDACRLACTLSVQASLHPERAGKHFNSKN